MNQAILQMLEPYSCQTTRDYENALKEIIQEIALLGLYRTNFYDHAAFYGGTALRILYGLPQFSEDLDFSLLSPNASFLLTPYLKAIQRELTAYGFQVSVEERQKNIQTQIDSAFIKTSTREHLIKIEAASTIVRNIQPNQNLTIKLEIDTDPPPDFTCEVKFQLQPIPYSIKVFAPPSLFAGKIHAILQRQWKGRVKGRDYYDFVWYLSRRINVDIKHLEARLRQSGGWSFGNPLTTEDVKDMLSTQSDRVDFEAAKKDILPFIKDKTEVDLWTPDFFKALLPRLSAGE